jgi:pimeloyl-ACP methyl ester carboxylesterase
VEAEIRYVRSGGVAIAYQVVGEGERDLVLVPDYCSNLVYGWESRYWRPFYERLAESFRLILFDKRGTGLSDRGGSFPTLETRMEDMRAVMGAVDSERALIFGSHEGCLMATLFAATYPEETAALALFHPPLLSIAGAGQIERAELLDTRERWGTRELCDEMLEVICPTLAGSGEGRRWFANWLRVGASPAMGYELNRAFAETDLTEVYAAVRAPTLVLYRDTLPPTPEESRGVAALIPQAHAMRVSGSDYWGVFLSLEIVDELERLSAGEAAPTIPESVLTTLLFTDIVGSSRLATEVGDRAWRDLLARHHASVRRELARHRGRRLLRHLRRTGTRDPLRPGSDRRRSATRDRHPGRNPHRGVRAPRREGRGRRALDRCPRLCCGAGRRGARLAHGQGSRRRLRNRVR